jgi:hypothetical protein
VREIRQHGSAGGGPEPNRASLPRFWSCGATSGVEPASLLDGWLRLVLLGLLVLLFVALRVVALAHRETPSCSRECRPPRAACRCQGASRLAGDAPRANGGRNCGQPAWWRVGGEANPKSERALPHETSATSRSSQSRRSGRRPLATSAPTRSQRIRRKYSCRG